jgi:hypothetical protein
MTLRLTIVLEEEHGQDLIGILAKGLARGEQGILDLRIERVDGPTKRIAPPIARIARRDVADLPRTRKSPGPKNGRQRMREVLLEALGQGDKTWPVLTEALFEKRYSRNSLNSALARLVREGLVARPSRPGLPYRLIKPATPDEHGATTGS